MEVAGILDRAEQLGIKLVVIGDRIRYRPASLTPADLVEAMRVHKGELLRLLGEHQVGKPSFQCWLLEEWRKVSIPDWRRILQESIQMKDGEREKYARWMLREILQDPGYQEANR